MSSDCEKCAELEAERALHSCPYAEDIEGNYDDVCACCADCEHDCAMAI